MVGFLNVAKRQALSLRGMAKLEGKPEGSAIFSMAQQAGLPPQQILTFVVLRAGNAAPREGHRVAGGRCSVGRDPGNDWVLTDRSAGISRRHFVVFQQEGRWQIIDLSKNGTFLNRETRPIGAGQRRTLGNGDRIRLGPYEVEVRLTTDVKRAGEAWGDRDNHGDGYRAPDPAAVGFAESAAVFVEAYLERLLKLIPSEVVSIYPVGRSLITNDSDQGYWTAVCLIICIVFRGRLTRGADGRPQWDAVAISSISFIIWVYVLGSHLPWLNIFPGHQVWPALAMIAWTTMTPTIYMARSA